MAGTQLTNYCDAGTEMLYKKREDFRPPFCIYFTVAIFMVL
jgi:hypothetical protein